MKITLMLCLLLAAVTVGAQTANVVQLEPVDTAKSQKAWEDLQKAQARWKDVNDQIDMKYVEIRWMEPGTAMTIGQDGVVPMHPRSGFENGFEFSKDFKYLVPKPEKNIGGSLTITPTCVNGICW